MHEKFDFDSATESVKFIKDFFKREKFPDTAIILGSGLGGVTENLKEKIILKNSDIPNYPESTAPGHAGNFVIGKLDNHEVIIIQGRVHFYECHSMKAVTFPVRILGMLGVKNYIATNAVGMINENFRAGDLIAVRDHINLMGDNPLIGKNESRWNERFPDMSNAYDTEFLRIFQDLGLQSGIYAAFSGPSFETPAEIRAAKILGADLAGMSTVPEVIVAHAMGMRVAVLSCIANKASGISETKLSAQEVLDVVKNFSPKFIDIIIKFINKIKN